MARSEMRPKVLLAFVLISLLLFGITHFIVVIGQGYARTATPALRFKDSSELTVSLSATAQTSYQGSAGVIVENTSASDVSGIRFTLVMTDEKGIVTTSLSLADPEDTMISSYSEKPFVLTLTLTAKPSAKKGFLLVEGKTDDGTKLGAGSRAVSLSTPKTDPPQISSLSDFIVAVVTLVVSFIVIVPVSLASKEKREALDSTKLPGPLTLDFGKSWATNMAIATTITTQLSSAFLSDNSRIISKAGITGLGIFFALLIVFAPIIYNSTLKVPPEKKEPETTATVFVWTAFLTLWGALGELALAVILLYDAWTQKAFSNLMAILFLILLVVVIIFLLIYTCKSIKQAIERKRSQVRARRILLETIENAEGVAPLRGFVEQVEIGQAML